MRSLLEAQRDFSARLAAPADARYAVYLGNVRENCRKALAGAYPIVCKIVGEAFFDAMAGRFIAEHPSRSGDLNEYGAGMAAFLEFFGEAQDLPYLPDVARVEWLAHRAHFAADTISFDATGLAGLATDAERVRVKLAPSCSLLASEWPLARIWAVHQDDYEGEPAVDLDAGGDCVLVHRPRWRVQVRSLDAGDWSFLGALSHGATLGEALAAAAEENADFDHATALARWIDAGVIASLA